MVSNECSDANVGGHTLGYTGYNYLVTHDGMTQKNPTSQIKPWVPAKWPDIALQSRVLNLILTTVLPHVPSGSVKVFTELKWRMMALFSVPIRLMANLESHGMTGQT